jgi:hypothetical protein
MLNFGARAVNDRDQIDTSRQRCVSRTAWYWLFQGEMAALTCDVLGLASDARPRSPGPATAHSRTRKISDQPGPPAAASRSRTIEAGPGESCRLGTKGSPSGYGEQLYNLVKDGR